MIGDLHRLTKSIDQAIGVKREKEKTLAALDQKINRTKREGWHIAQSKDIIHALALKTQEGVQLCLEGAVTHSLRSVFDDPYKFHVDFEIKRQRTEAELTVSNQGEKVKPKDSSGGGLMDVISFTLKVLLWSLSPRKPAPILILDEPFSWLDAERLPRAGELLREIQKQMGIQFIIITHEEELLNTADSVFRITNKTRKSKVVVQ